MATSNRMASSHGRAPPKADGIEKLGAWQHNKLLRRYTAESKQRTKLRRLGPPTIPNYPRAAALLTRIADSWDRQAKQEDIRMEQGRLKSGDIRDRV